MSARAEAPVRSIGTDPAAFTEFYRVRPLAILLIGVLHCIPDADDPAGIVAALVGAIYGGIGRKG